MSCHPRNAAPAPDQTICALQDWRPADAESAHTEYTPSQEIYEAWLVLPLIVLAGLR